MKRTRIRFSIGFNLALLMLAQIAALIAPSSVAYNQVWSDAKKRPGSMSVSARDIGARVKQLEKNNKDVRAALQQFESRDYKPKFQEASSLVGWFPPSSSSRTDAESESEEVDNWRWGTHEGTKVELIWVPVLNIAYEWHGTAIALLYDWEGNFIAQYVANIVLVMPDRKQCEWVVVYEGPVYGGKLHSDVSWPGMTTKIDPGEPLDWKWLKWNMSDWPNNPVDKGLENVTVLESNWQAWFRCLQNECGGWTSGCAGVSTWSAEIAWEAGCSMAAIDCSYERLWR